MFTAPPAKLNLAGGFRTLDLDTVTFVGFQGSFWTLGRFFEWIWISTGFSKDWVLVFL